MFWGSKSQKDMIKQFLKALGLFVQVVVAIKNKKKLVNKEIQTEKVH